MAKVLTELTGHLQGSRGEAPRFLDNGVQTQLLPPCQHSAEWRPWTSQWATHTHMHSDQNKAPIEAWIKAHRRSDFMICSGRLFYIPKWQIVSILMLWIWRLASLRLKIQKSMTHMLHMRDGRSHIVCVSTHNIVIYDICGLSCHILTLRCWKSFGCI